jgi:WD40 repeat protein
VVGWNLEADTLTVPNANHGSTVQHLSLIGDDRFLISSADRIVRVWKAGFLDLVYEFFTDSPITCIKSIGGEKFAIGMADGQVGFFSLENMDKPQASKRPGGWGRRNPRMI